MAKMAKLGFGPSLALYHSQKDPRGDHKMFQILSPCDRDGDNCPTSMSCHAWGSLLFRKTLCTLLSMAKMAKLGFGPRLAQYHIRKDPCRGHETF